MVVSPPRRTRRSRLKADFSDAGVSEVLANILLVAMTVGLLGGFGALVLTTVSNDTPSPPAASFTLEPTLGDDTVQVRLVSGAPLELGATTLRLFVNGEDLTESVDVDGDVGAQTWGPGQTLFLTLSRPLAADDSLMFLAADNGSGKSVGMAYGTVSGTVVGTVLVRNELTPSISFDPSTLVTDGVTTTAATIDVGASMGLLLVDHVTIDLSPVGGGAGVRLYDDGLGEDELAGDGVFTVGFSVATYDYPSLPGVVAVPLTATVYDVLGKSQPATGALTLQEPTPSKAGAGVIFRDIGSSTEIGTNGYIDLAEFVLRGDGSEITNDQIELRVSDLVDPTKVWTALVSFAYNTAECPGLVVATSVELKLTSEPGSVVYTPADGDCFEITPDSVLDLANIQNSETTTAVTWEATGDESTHIYAAADISEENEALISFFGDTVSLSPSARGLDQTDFAWGPGSGGATAPQAIADLVATPGNTVADLAWSAPNDGGDAITEYNVYRNGVLVATVPAPATSYQVTGLTNGVLYTFRVRAVNSVGEAPTSNAATATPSTTPSAPTLTATGDDGEVDLSWTVPSSGGSAITGYKIYMGTTSGSLSLLTTVAAGTTAHTATGLTNGVTYYFVVAATNANGEGAASAEKPATPTAAATAPSAVTDLVATAGMVQVQLDWSAPSNGGSAVTGYQIWRSTSSGAQAQLAAYTGTNTTWLDLNVLAGTTYYYKVKAVNAIGASALSNEQSATPTAVPTAPGAPTDLTATAGVGQVALGWSSPSNGGSPITGYQIWRGTSSGSETQIASCACSNLTWNDLNVVAGTTYYYQIKAVNLVGASAASTEQTATPPTVPSAPSGLSATASVGQVALSWSVPANGGSAITGYQIWRGGSSGAETLLTSCACSNLSWLDQNVAAGSTYFYYLKAVNAVGASSASSEQSASVPTVPNAPVLANTASVGQNSLSWTLPASGGSSITGYSIWRSTTSGFETLLTSCTCANRTWVDQNVAAGTTYYYQVRAVNAVGSSAPSNEVSGAIPNVPSAPSGLGATASPGQVALSWSEPANGGSAITGYQIWRSTSSGGETLLASYTGTNLTYTDLNVVAGTTYYYQVKAVNAVGASSLSNEASAALPNVPSAPSSLAATAAVGQVGLAWTAPSNGGSAITGYQVWRATSSGAETLLASCACSNLTWADQNVVAGTTYYYQIKAVNAVGTSSASNEASGTPPTVPTAPSTLAASAGAQQVSLTWSAPANGGSAITGYQIWRSTSSGTESLLVSCACSNLTWLDQNVVAGTTYFYQIKAVNAVGASALSNEVSATPTSAGVPSAPLSPRATPANNQVAVSWTTPSSTGGSAIQGYKVYRNATGSSTMVLLASYAGTNTTFIDATAKNNVTYTYSVRAYNANGDGAMSAQVTGRPNSNVDIDCTTFSLGFGALGAGESCTALQFGGTLANLSETDNGGGGGSTKEASATFSMNVTGITGTKTLEMRGERNNAPENLLLQAWNPTSSTWVTIITLPSGTTSQSTFTGSIAMSTYTSNGVIQLRIKDNGADSNNSSWIVDFVRLVT